MVSKKEYLVGRRLILISILFFILLSSATSAYLRPQPVNSTDSPQEDSSGQYRMLGSSSDLTVMSPAPNVGYWIDAPWRVELGAAIPVLAIADPMFKHEITKLEVVDSNTGAVLDEMEFSPSVPVGEDKGPFFYLFEIDADDYVSEGGIVTLELKFHIDHSGSNVYSLGPLDVHISSFNLPSVDNWFMGDTHFHTIYSYNFVEFGAPFLESKKMAQAIGLDWFTPVDHSLSFDNYFPGSSEYYGGLTWDYYVSEANTLSDDDFAILPSEEVSVNHNYYPYNHLLAHGISEYIIGGEALSPPFYTAGYTPAEAIEVIHDQGGSSYAAHPYHFDGLRIKWSDSDLKLSFTGLQLWNYASDKKHPVQFEKTYDKWLELLSEGRQTYVVAGTDAHADFNEDMGKARTYVHCPGQSHVSQECVKDALNKGRATLTNGPFLSFKINGALLGETISMLAGSNPALDIEWRSTPEFGEVERIEIWKNGVNVYNLTGDTVKDRESAYWTDPEPLTGETYYRLEAYTDKPCEKYRTKNDANYYSAYTNPIWVRPTLSVPGSATGVAAANSEWTTTLDASALSFGFQLTLNWDSSNELDLVLTDTAGKVYDKNMQEEKYSYSGSSSVRPIVMKFSELTAAQKGVWAITVKNKDDKFSDFTISTKKYSSTEQDNGVSPGGVNMAGAMLSFVSTCSDDGSLQFVLEGKEGPTDDPFTFQDYNRFLKYLKTSITVEDWKQYVSLLLGCSK